MVLFLILEKTEKPLISTESFGVFISVSFCWSSTKKPSKTTDEKGLMYRLFIETSVFNFSEKYFAAFFAAHVCTGLYWKTNNKMLTISNNSNTILKLILSSFLITLCFVIKNSKSKNSKRECYL